jgi:AcrR family transcriptional regulator
MSSVTPSADPDVRPLRRDAERNRQLVLDAARQVFAVRGVEAGFDEIARAAGVGAATVYRRFPERSDLVDALFEQDVEEMVSRAHDAGAGPDAWAGLCSFLRWGVELQARNRGLAQVLAATGHGTEHIEKARAEIAAVVDALVARAQDAGVLRDDVAALDLLLSMTLVAQVGDVDDHEARERLVTLALDGFLTRRDRPTALPSSPPTEQDLAGILDPLRRFHHVAPPR